MAERKKQKKAATSARNAPASKAKAPKARASKAAAPKKRVSKAPASKAAATKARTPKAATPKKRVSKAAPSKTSTSRASATRAAAKRASAAGMAATQAVAKRASAAGVAATRAVAKRASAAGAAATRAVAKRASAASRAATRAAAKQASAAGKATRRAAAKRASAARAAASRASAKLTAELKSGASRTAAGIKTRASGAGVLVAGKLRAGATRAGATIGSAVKSGTANALSKTAAASRAVAAKAAVSRALAAEAAAKEAAIWAARDSQEDEGRTHPARPPLAEEGGAGRDAPRTPSAKAREEAKAGAVVRGREKSRKGQQFQRLKIGGRIEHDAVLEFTFDGKRYEGHPGDTLASALLANNVHLVARSFKYHRPRGILSAGAEEPNALVRVGTGARVQPNLRATQVELYDGLVAESQNRHPSLTFDLGAINAVMGRFLPAGFYYKTFMWPASMWMTYEHYIRAAAGLGRAPEEHVDPDRYEKTNLHCEVFVAGGGGTGLMAGLAAGRSGARVVIADEQNELGGWLLGEADTLIDSKDTASWIASVVAELEAMPDVTLLRRTTVFGYMDHNYLTLLERVCDHLGETPSHLPRQRMHKVRADQVVLAQGAHERPLVFAGNDLPGVMLSGAVRSYVNRHAIIPGNRAIVFTNNDDAYRTALDLHHIDVHVVVVDIRHDARSGVIEEAEAAGIEILRGHAVTSVADAHHVGHVEVAEVDDDAKELISEPFHIDCDLLAMSGGLSPAVHLHSQSRGKLVWDNELLCFRPSTAHEASLSAGACNGVFDLEEALIDGAHQGAAAAELAGYPAAKTDIPTVVTAHQNWKPKAAWSVPSEHAPGRGPKAFVDFQNDVTSGDVSLAVREGYESVEHLKRYTTLGMATDQGKTSNVNGLAILADALGKDIAQVGTTTFRMPYTPAGFGAIAGRETGALFDPVRRTILDSWHQSNGAMFEHVGQWMRAWYYPREGEGMQDAVNREVRAARTTAGLLDASTLGKIDIRGRHAGEFLNRIYTNGWRKLGVGRCRYGLMLGDDGMVMDDGVTTRLGDNHYHMTTTTGGAASVLAWLEEWLQTEWPELDVYLTSVTEEWAVATLSGPNAGKILQAAGIDINLDPAKFPFMSMREAHISGLPVRIFRISFTGELSYEINIRARHGMALWTLLMNVGAEYGITPYGTEAMHVLRAEKGFIIVGQETDGSMTPQDLGMEWIISTVKPDFIGKRALERVGMSAKGRKQLVGLLTKDESRVIPEGAHAVLNPRQSVPMDLLGHVTSSYFSPNLGRSIALAMLKSGRSLKGKRVYLPMLEGGMIEAEVVDPVFYDPKGERING